MSTVVPLTAARLPQLDPHNVALGQLWRHRGESRIDALNNCIEHLVVNHDMSEPTAELSAIQAYAEMDSANQLARIDTDATTSHVVVLRDEGGRPVMFTVTDLMHVLKQARVDGRAVVVDRDTRRPVVFKY